MSPVSAPVARLGMRLANPAGSVLFAETPAESVAAEESWFGSAYAISCSACKFD